MAHIAYITNGMASTVNSGLELSRRLVERGHSVTYLSPADLGERVRAHGHAFVRLDEARRLRERLGEDRAPWREPVRLIAWLRRRLAARAASIGSDEVGRAVEELAPDLVVIDIEMHLAVIRTARLALPTVLVMSWFTPFRASGLPPLHSLLTADASPRAIARAWRRHRLESAWLRWRRATSWRGLRSRLLPVGPATTDPVALAAVARTAGYPLARRTDRGQWLRPFIHTHLKILSFTARELELAHEPDPRLVYTGPMVHHQRIEPELMADDAAALHDLLEQGDARPLVYVSLGTHWAADEAFLRPLLSVFEGRPDWRAVLGMGGQRLALSAPSNVLVLGYAPQLQILSHARCAVTHGGITTINECLTLGVPMVVCSTGHVDQNGCAVRVAAHGVGLSISGASKHELERAIEHVIHDDTMRGRLEAFETAAREYAASCPGVATIEAELALRQARGAHR